MMMTSSLDGNDEDAHRSVTPDNKDGTDDDCRYYGNDHDRQP